MRICICGGGSLGTVCGAVFASQGNDVTLLTGHPSEWSHNISAIDPDGKTFEGSLAGISDLPEKVAHDADIILLCVPGYLIEDTLSKIKPVIRPGAIIGSVVSSTGFFFFAHKILPPSTPLFGFQRVPFIARTQAYGKSAFLLGYKKNITVALENIPEKNSFLSLLSQLFITPVDLAANYLEVSLTNSNPILHTGRLYAMWRESNGTPFVTAPLFYADWTDLSSEYIIKMDKEFQSLLRKLEIPKDAIPTLLDYYESKDPKSLTKKIRSIPAFKNIKSPLVKTPEGWILDSSSRYFTEDFPFGLKFIKELADANYVEIPMIEEIYKWGSGMVNSRHHK